MDGSLALGGAGASGGSWSFDDWRDRAKDAADKAKDYAQSIKQSISPAFLRRNEDAAIEDEAENNSSVREGEKNVIADSASKTKENAAKITNAVQGIVAARSGNLGQAMSKAKQAGPVLGIIVGIIIFAMSMYLGDSLMPFSAVSHLINEGGTNMEAGIARRTDNLLRYQMNPLSRKTTYAGYTLKNVVSPLSPTSFTPSKRQKTKLANQGITFEETDGVQVMKYKGQTIVADESLVDSFPGSKSLKAALNEGGDFSHSFLQGTMTLRSKVRYWFDTKVGELLLKLRVSRNKTKNSSDGDIEEVKRLTADADDIDMKRAKMTDELDFEEDDHNEMKQVKRKGQTIELDIEPGDSEATMHQKVEAVATTKANKMNKAVQGASRAVSAIANTACMAVNLASSITSIMRVLQLDQMRQVSMMVLEVVQKTQIGDNTNELFNTVAGMLGKVETTTYKTGEYGNEGTTSLTGSATESNLALSTYEEKPRAPDASVESLNPLSGLGSFWKSLGQSSSTISTFMACASIKMVAAAADAVADGVDLGMNIAEIATCIAGAAATYGASCAWLIGHLVVDVALSIGAAVAVSTIVQSVVSWVVPKVANMFMRDITNILAGHDFGNIVFGGGLSTMADVYQSHGGGYLTKGSYLTYRKLEEEHLAEKAHYERQNHSPLDPTSEYTFLGSLLTKFGLLSSTIKTPVAALTALGSTALSSANKLLPHAAAISDADKAEYLEKFTEKYCPNLAGIGALARDGYCTKLMGQSVSTLDDDPLIVQLEAGVSSSGEKNFEDEPNEEGMPVIKQDSDLMKYILSVVDRQSEPGIADENIANTLALCGSGVGCTALSATPVIGGIADMIDNTTSLENIGYISGRAGVVENDGTELGALVVKPKKAAQYAQFIIDQGIYEAAGISSKSAVTAALETYYENHPIDESFEGILARKTGMTKENVVATLDFIKLANFMNEYEPTQLYPYIARQNNDSAINLDNKTNIGMPSFLVPNEADLFVGRREYYIS